MEYNTHVYTYKSLPNDLLMQYGKMRYGSFQPDDPNVTWMDHKNKIELDRFDEGLSEPLYLMVTANDGPKGRSRLVTGMRFIGCDKEYDLEHSSWSYLTDGVNLPKSPNIVETTRWVGKSSNSEEGMVTTGLLNMRMVELGKEMGWTKTIGSPTEMGSNWCRKRGAKVIHLGQPWYSPREKANIQLTIIDIDEFYFKMGFEMLQEGMGLRSISRLSLNTEAA